MGGGLMQLVAYGAQDIYLTGNPQITFFKVVYRRHTNFAMEVIEQTLSGANTTAGGSGTCTVSRNGDLVGRVYVTSSTASIDDGDAMVSQVDLEIGGQLIDRHYQEWMQVWSELSTPESKAVGRKAMCGAVGSSGGTGVGMVQVPLQFWFCRNPGLALPLIALQYHEVKLKFTWGTAANVGIAATCKVMVDYIYLDTDERRRFAQVSHEYLIEQVQRQQDTAATSMKLNFNHPVKELVWTGTSYTDARLTLNGHDRISAQEKEYFQLRQPFDHHTAIPRQNLPSVITTSVGEGEYVDVFNGTNLPGNTVEAQDFADAAVTSGDVIVSQGGGGLLSACTAAVTAGEAETATTLIYSFLTADLGVTLTSGDEVEITVDGSGSISNADGTSTTVRTRVTQAHAGALAAGLTDTNNTHIQLADSLCEPTLGAEIDGADDFAITSFRVRRANTARTSNLTKKVNVYSFALNPEEHQPSGTCNFSRIDAAHLKFGGTPSVGGTAGGTMNIYAVNYNVLRIMSGMGGLAYSN
jgi:hypothetical protein